ncbi:hypothetical protein AQUCO_00700568v1 [Aquilegia coerulea]|uniref:PCI domain-containing protein n=1 Tax=Aquilegia coerulea TaxID=218851 RepID=A0A2G5EKS5_AQUCA|nr:hypothetical protein AQUCO_00700568v1 [Aquilegia coerulea]
MTHQGASNTDAMANFDPNTFRYVDINQGASSAYSSLNTGVPSTTAPWTMKWADNNSTLNGVAPSSSYYHGQQNESLARDNKDVTDAASQAVAVPSLGTSHGPQEHAGYSSYSSSTDTYGHDNTGYQGYYNGYHQQTSNTYSQQVGAYQTSGAPYQPLTSVDNSGSYAGSTSYSNTYYNTGDYQTTGGYPSDTNNNQSTSWSDGSYANYPSHQYSNYSSLDSNGAHNSSTVAAAPLSYEQQYKQWADYYSHTASDVSCAPGTENISATGASAQNTQTPGSYFQKPSDLDPVPYENSQDLQKSASPQRSNSQYPLHQISQSYHSPIQTVSSFDARRVNKVQIPTNPRIASSLTFGLPKTDKDSPTKDAVTKPAYVSVSLPKCDTKVLSHDAADSMLKPGMFPASLRAYVERALARCKNDLQKTACQTIMKEMITKASADGTLFTRNWDIEPLFPLPDMDVHKDISQKSSIVSALPKYKRSPSRRSKSRWEPLPEERLVEKLTPVNQASVKEVSWDFVKEREQTGSGGKNESKEEGWSNAKFLQSQQQNQIALANTPEERKRRESRSKRFEKGQGQRAEMKHFRPKSAGSGSLYTKRASAMVIAKSYEDGGSRPVEDIDWDSLTVRGTCQEIEKRYLRLTSAPDPATVRPEEVLEKALQMVLSSQKNYLYKCDQLKSIRQDLTVQRIRNELTVKVYETHARIALEAGDLPEYNQCQSQLKILYAEGIKGCHMEFSAYNLLCVILHSNKSRDLVSSMARLSAEAKKNPAVKHALEVRAAVTSGNYVLFFRLYKTAPNLNTCLMDLYVEKMRYEAVKCMSRSYRPTVPLSFIAEVLGFVSSLQTENNDEKHTDVLEECEEWLRAHGACLIVDNSGDMQLDTKASSSSLFMPEPEDAVAHGDANLAVNDFLTRTA